MKSATDFLAQNPTPLASYGGYRLFEHPTRGDTAPVYMVTPTGCLINTGFYDLGDFECDGLDLCLELDPAPVDPAKEAAQARWHYHEENDTLDLY